MTSEKIYESESNFFISSSILAWLMPLFRGPNALIPVNANAMPVPKMTQAGQKNPRGLPSAQMIIMMTQRMAKVMRSRQNADCAFNRLTAAFLMSS